MFLKYSCRRVILIVLVAMIFSLLLFPVARGQTFLMALSRLITGFFQVA